jgi:hypothetical protein
LKNNHALITLSGLDFVTFKAILQSFKYYFDHYAPFTEGGTIEMLDEAIPQGGPRLIKASNGSGLVPTSTRTHGSTSVLQLIFGMTQSSTSEHLAFSTHILIMVLRQMDDARVNFPTDDEIHLFKEVMKCCPHRLDGVWCTIDGLKSMLESESNDNEQNRFYNGCRSLVFCPNGMIPICCYNVPGMVHDSSIAMIGNGYKKHEEVFDGTGGICVTDSAFSPDNNPFIIQSGKPTADMTIDKLNILEEVTSMRQRTKWGMRAFQSFFP